MASVLGAASAQPPAPTGKRTEYQHPDYKIGRSARDTGAKDLLYPVPLAPAPVTAATMDGSSSNDGEDPFLVQVFSELQERVRSVPRGGDGCIDEQSMRSLLQAFGLNLSSDGFAELLARCDVAGFPTFRQFLAILTRPESVRRLAAEPDMDIAAPAPAMQEPATHVEDDVQFANPPVSDAATEQDNVASPPEEQFEQLTLEDGQAPVVPGEETHAQRTWRHMQVAERVSQAVAPLPKSTKTSMPLGIKSSCPPLGANLPVSSKVGRTSGFTKAFLPDAYLY